MTEVLARHSEAVVVLSPPQRRVLHNLLSCRTEALGGHRYLCPACGYQRIHYNSCRDRHCPQCQASRRCKWVDGRMERVLQVGHFQVTVTLPAQLRPLARQYPRELYSLLFEVTSGVLQHLAAQRMDARLGITAVRHTWRRDLGLHPHLHCIVTAGGLRRDDEKWAQPPGSRFLCPVRILRRLVRSRFLERLDEEVDGLGLDAEAGKAYATLRRTLYRKRWVVHIEPPAHRPVGHLVKYLARYVYGVAISDQRLVSHVNGEVSFRTRGQRTVTLAGPEFVRRFLLHVLPAGFVKVRHYGLYAPSNVPRRLPIAHRLVAQCDPPARAQPDPGEPDETAEEATPVVPTCPACGPTVSLLVFVIHRSRGPPTC